LEDEQEYLDPRRRRWVILHQEYPSGVSIRSRSELKAEIKKAGMASPG